MKYNIDKRITGLVIISLLSVISILWTFYVFKKHVSLSFVATVIILRCASSLILFKDYAASWRKSTSTTFLRKVLVNIPSLLVVVIVFHGHIQFALMFSEFMFYLILINISVFMYAYIANRPDVDKTCRAVIYGAGEAGIRMAQELTGTKYKVRYFVDDNPEMQKRSIDGKRVLSIDQLRHRLLKYELDMLIIALPSAKSSRIKDIYKSLEKDFSQIKILPAIENVLQNDSFLSQLKPVSVYDLLARDTKSLDKNSIYDFLNGKSILVTGAGGSIGSEIVRKCVKYGASEVILIDHSEYNLYKISEELSSFNIKSVLCSVCNKKHLHEVFSEYNPDIVFHAAAYKHVPLVENSIKSAIFNNIIGTKNTIDAAILNHVKSFILISTDKAVRPTNVMGATKRICELYLQNVEPKRTKLAAVRFGNVLGSSGSVIPKFEEQVKNGGPVTVTHADITRYFMLIPEACDLVLQAGAIAKNSEVIVLDMGKSVKIMDLAKQFIKLSGQDDVEIKITGLRPGEKLYEELLIDETDVRTDYKDILIGKKTYYDIDKLSKDISHLADSTDDTLAILKQIIPEFDHQLNK